MSLERLDGRRPSDVPDDQPAVCAGGNGGASVGAEHRSDHSAVVASGGVPDVAGREVEEAHGAVGATDEQRAIVGAQGQLRRTGRRAPQRPQSVSVADDAAPPADDRDQAPAAAGGEQCDVARFADPPLPAEPSAGECVEVLDDRREFRWRRDCGEQRASVVREAQPVDEPLVDPQGEELALGPDVDDGRLAAPDRKP